MFGESFSRLTPFERILSLLTSVRPGEGRGTFLLLAQFYLLILAYYLIRPVREALILTEGSPEIRAYSGGAIAITLIFLIPLYKLLFNFLDGNGSKVAMLRWVSLFFATNLLVFAFLVWQGVPVAVPFFIWVGIFSVMVVAQFWAFAADLFNIKTGQRLFAVIMVGAALGAISGSQIAGRLHAVLGTPLLMVLSAALLACVIMIGEYAQHSIPEGSRSASRKTPHPPARPLSDIAGGFNVVFQSRYLLLIALFILLFRWIHSTGGYILSSFVSNHASDVVMAAGATISRTEVISRFYGNFFTWTTGLQLVLQLLLVSRIFRWFGVRGAILVLPLVMILNYGLVAMVPVFALVRLMMILETGTRHSILGTTNHALYLPVSREEKYVGKTTIDTFFYRFGDLIHAGMIFVAAQALGLGVHPVIYLNVGLAVVLLWIGTAIGRHHRREIRQNMENLPPVVKAPLPEVYAPAGQMLVFSVPEQAIMDPDPGDTLTYKASRSGERRLPSWIRFDPYNQTFTLRPPAGSEGALDVELVATDFEGLSVQSEFRIRYGPEPVPRFITAPATTAPGQSEPGSGDDEGTVP